MGLRERTGGGLWGYGEGSGVSYGAMGQAIGLWGYGVSYGAGYEAMGRVMWLWGRLWGYGAIGLWAVIPHPTVPPPPHLDRAAP